MEVRIMENNQGKGKSEKRTDHARHWPAMLISMMIIVPMFVVLGFYASVSAQAASPAAVNLGTAGNFVILSQAGITTTGPTQITGDVGVSPIAATAMTGFGLILDASGTFSTSALVTGKVYAADYAAPTPAMLTTAVSDMQTAYNDAAGRAADFTELYSGDLTGQTLVPGVYAWSSVVTIGAAGVTLAGGATDVWIFQIAQGLTLASGAQVTLSGGAQASNIFWQVAGQATLGTTAAMKGIILCKTAIVMNTGATLEGRALAQTAVTLDSNAITSPGAGIVQNHNAIDNLKSHLAPNSGMPEQSQKGQQNALNHLLANQDKTHDSDDENEQPGC
jgi:Ice-binding-like